MTEKAVRTALVNLVRAHYCATHPDEGEPKREPNHYERFDRDSALELLSDAGLADMERKYTEALSDVYVHDHAKIALELIEEIRRARVDQPKAPEGEGGR